MTKAQIIEFLNGDGLNIQDGATLIESATRIVEHKNKDGEIRQLQVPIIVGRAYRIISNETKAFTYRELFAFDKGNYASVTSRQNALPLSESFKIDGVIIVDNDGKRIPIQAMLRMLDEVRKEGLLGELTNINYEALDIAENQNKTLRLRKFRIVF